MQRQKLLSRWFLQCLLALGLSGGLVLPATAAPIPAPVTAPVAETDIPAAPNRNYVPIVSNRACTKAKSADMPMGVQMYGETGRPSDLFAPLQDSGVAWVRVNIDWVTAEPSDVPPSQYNWSSMESSFRAANDACVNIIAILDNAPNWAATFGRRSPIKPEHMNDFVDFVRTTVERYDGDGIDDTPSGIVVTHWEFYNEPDFEVAFIEDEQGWGAYGDKYAEMLKTIYPVVKAANPDAQVVFGGIHYDWFREDGGHFQRSFLDDVLAAGGGEYFDIMNFHYYPNFRSSWTSNINSSGLVEKISALRAKLAEYGLNKPMIITEIGWHSNSDDTYPSTPESQSRHVVQLLTQSLASDLDIVIWWMLESPIGGGQPYPYDTGLVTSSSPPAPKPAFSIFRQAVRRLSYADFTATVSSVSAGNVVEAYSFRDKRSGQTFYVAWLNPISSISEATQPLEISASRVTVVGKDGVQIAVIQDGDDGNQNGKVIVPVGGSPIYIYLN